MEILSLLILFYIDGDNIINFGMCRYISICFEYNFCNNLCIDVNMCVYIYIIINKLELFCDILLLKKLYRYNFER